MKKLLFSSVLVVTGLFFSIAQEIEVDKDVINYGKIANGSNGVREFVITNSGDKPLIINNVLTSCGCTTPSVPKKPIMPGQSEKLKIEYDTKRIGSFSKSITILSNAQEKARMVVSIKGIVE